MLRIAVILVIGCSGAQQRPAPIEETGCEPGRCLDDVARVMKEHRPEMRACYELAQAQRAGLEGSMTVNFVIDPQGAVVETSPSVRDGEIEDAELFDCLSSMVKQVTFMSSPTGKRTRAYHVFDFKKP